MIQNPSRAKRLNQLNGKKTSSEVRKKTRVSTFPTLIQHHPGIPNLSNKAHHPGIPNLSNKAERRNKRNSNRKERIQTIPICRLLGLT
jgi:hypothetical protein